MSKRVLISHETLSNAVQMVKDKYQQSNGMTITDVEIMVKETPNGTEQSENITTKSSSCCEGTKFITSDGLKSVGDSPITLVTVEGLTAPMQPPADGLVWADYGGLCGNKDNLIVYSGLSQLYRSNNGGFDWHTITDTNVHSLWGFYDCPGGNFDSMAYNGVDTFVACNYYFYYLVYSKDNGNTWHKTDNLTTYGYYNVCYCNNKFFAFGADGPQVAYSEDGITWTQIELPYPGIFFKVVWGGDKYITIPLFKYVDGEEYDADTGLYSYDGIEWIPMKLPAAARWDDFNYVNNEFILYRHEWIHHSEDGINWQLPDNIPLYTWSISAQNENGTIVLLPQNTRYNFALVSTNNQDWEEVPLPEIDDDGWISVVWDGEKFIGLSYDFFMIYSYDGFNWSNIHAVYGVNPYIKYYNLIKE